MCYQLKAVRRPRQRMVYWSLPLRRLTPTSSTYGLTIPPIGSSSPKTRTDSALPVFSEARQRAAAVGAQGRRRRRRRRAAQRATQPSLIVSGGSAEENFSSGASVETESTPSRSTNGRAWKTVARGASW
mmetsp:Transcript_8436/g.20220  ORF Transcript_8436/g.20220 Transcript_8436/m.20220 type:complete len:129 (-) Transcript_8436:1281-1667(-)